MTTNHEWVTPQVLCVIDKKNYEEWRGKVGQDEETWILLQWSQIQWLYQIDILQWCKVKIVLNLLKEDNLNFRLKFFQIYVTSLLHGLHFLSQGKISLDRDPTREHSKFSSSSKRLQNLYWVDFNEKLQKFHHGRDSCLTFKSWYFFDAL